MIKPKVVIWIVEVLAILFVVALFLPDLQEFDVDLRTVGDDYSPLYTKSVDFLSDNLGFDQTIGGGAYVFFYSLVVSFFIWVYYHFFLLLRMISTREASDFRKPDVEGVDAKLFSLSRFRFINLFFGRVYKCLAFAFFTLIVYNVPIVNRLVYLYILDFLDYNFFADAFIMSILFVVLPKILESYLWERRKGKLEEGLERAQRVRALGEK